MATIMVNCVFVFVYGDETKQVVGYATDNLKEQLNVALLIAADEINEKKRHKSHLSAVRDGLLRRGSFRFAFDDAISEEEKSGAHVDIREDDKRFMVSVSFHKPSNNNVKWFRRTIKVFLRSQIQNTGWYTPDYKRCTSSYTRRPQSQGFLCVCVW